MVLLCCCAAAAFMGAGTALQVKAAEADGESKYLSGVGIAKQRQAIVNGLQETVQTFADEVEGARPKDVMDLLLVTQYFDMMKDLSSRSGKNGNSIFLPHGPNSVAALRQDLQKTFMSGEKQA